MATSRYAAAATSMAKATWHGNVKYMILHVNSVCNAKCRMCFSWDGMQARWDPKGISLEHLTKLAKSMSPLPQLTCSGGEPLLRRDLPEIVQAFYDHAETRFFTVPTNTLQPKRVETLIDHFLKHCPLGFLNFCLPFHGPRELFDEVMGVPGNFDSFQETYRLIQSKRKEHKNISCVLNFVMSKFNYSEYKSTIDLAVTDYAEAPIGIAFCRGNTHEPGATEVPLDVYRAAHDYLSERRTAQTTFNPYDVMFSSLGDWFRDTISDVVNGTKTDLACGAGRHLLVTYDNGDVYPCELLDCMGLPKARPGETAPSATKLGNLADFDFSMASLLAGEQAKSVVQWIQTHPCACTWECAIYSKAIHSPGEWAKLGQRIGQKLIKGKTTSSAAHF